MRIRMYKRKPFTFYIKNKDDIKDVGNWKDYFDSFKVMQTSQIHSVTNLYFQGISEFQNYCHVHILGCSSIKLSAILNFPSFINIVTKANSGKHRESLF